uniref:hypothetical protein n=1 Tax=Dysosmobacter welbionis TaxID=2093857 RepID=UPI00307AAF5C
GFGLSAKPARRFLVRISDCLLCFKFFFRFLGNSRFLAYILLYNKASAHKNAAERMDTNDLPV